MDTLQDTQPLPHVDASDDTGRHHMYRSHTDCAAATSVRRQIASAMRGIPLDPGQHRSAE